MAKITKPDLSIQWAQAGSTSVPLDAKKLTGWVAEKPPFEVDNWLQNRQDKGIAYIFQMGIPEWDATTEYQSASGYASFVQYNKVVYVCIQTGTNQNPSTATAYWAVAFDAYGAASTVQSNLSTHITNYGTLTGLTNASTARSNLGVYSKTESDNNYAQKAGDTSITFNVATATADGHAVPKAQFDAKTGIGTTTTEGIYKVASDAQAIAFSVDNVVITPARLGYVFSNKVATTTSNGTVMLVDNATVITGTDSNKAVTTAALTNLFTGTGRVSTSTNGYYRLPGKLVEQWGTVTGGSGDVSISWPFTDIISVLNIVCSPINVSPTGFDSVNAKVFNTSGATFSRVSGPPSAAGGFNFCWRALTVAN